MVARARGEDTPSELKSWEEEEDEGEVTPPPLPLAPLSLQHETLPSFDNIIN
jgi:hypothetical protein